MRPADAARLVALALIWSASFAFIRVLAPVLGPVWVAAARLLLGGGALVLGLLAVHRHANPARHWRAYLFVGIVNSALPFLLFGYAALVLPASHLVILNAALPRFALAQPEVGGLSGLLAQVPPVAALDRLERLVGLLDQVGHQRRVGLLRVPGAAAR